MTDLTFEQQFEQAHGLWLMTPPATPENDMRAFANLIFTPYPEYPHAVRMRRDDGTRDGAWHEVIAYDPDEAVNIAKTFDGVEDVYIIASPLSRKPVGQTTFQDILRVCWLPVDIDAKSIDAAGRHEGWDEARDKRYAAANQLEQLVNYYLPTNGYEGKPACGFTGNGYLAMLRIDHPVDDPKGPHKVTRERVLGGLKKQFSGVDTTMTNAARLVRFLGTMNMSFAVAGKDGVPKRSYLIIEDEHGLLA